MKTTTLSNPVMVWAMAVLLLLTISTQHVVHGDILKKLFIKWLLTPEVADIVVIPPVPVQPPYYGQAPPPYYYGSRNIYN